MALSRRVASASDEVLTGVSIEPGVSDVSGTCGRAKQQPFELLKLFELLPVEMQQGAVNDSHTPVEIASSWPNLSDFTIKPSQAETTKL